ncbi:MAG: Gldg family protein [Lachnospiraceae bacterium]|nr:Gldg family protein [Lachnospiraceae bacterium]
MLTIYLKELRSNFKSFFGWLFLAVYTFFCSLYFVIYNILNGSPYLSSTVSSLVVILMFVFPLLTMRILAEEKKLRTDQLLLTSPVRISSIILGKFFSLVTMMLIASAVLLLGLLIMSFYGTVPVAESLLAILALILLGSMFASIGLFLSALTEHQFVAAILTYGAFIFIMLVPSALQIFFASNKVVSTVAKAIDFLAPFDKLLTGIINAADIFRILSIIAIFLLLAARVFGKSALDLALVGSKKFFLSTAGIVAIIVLIIAANVGANYIPVKYIQYDATKTGYYTLTKESKEMVKSLDEDVTIHVLTDKNLADNALNLYLEQYEAASGHIKVKYHSQKTEPTFYTAYTKDAPSSGSLIITMGDKNRVIDSGNYYIREINYNTYQYDTTGVDIEGQITAAIGALKEGKEFKVYFIEGHNELPPTDAMIDRLRKAGFTYESISLMTIDSLPEDCSAVVVNGPNTDLSKEDVKKIKSYIDKGGVGVLLAAADTIETPNYDELLSSYGAELVKGTVYEKDYQYNFQGEGFYLVYQPVAHAITNKNYSGKRLSLLVQSKGFIISESDDPNLVCEPLFNTSDTAVAYQVGENGEVKTDEDVAEGPFTVAFYSEKISEAAIGKVTVIGSPLFLYDAMDAATAYANSDLFIESLNYSCDTGVVATIPAKSYEMPNLFVSQGVALLYAALLVVLLPLAEIIAGIVIMIIRRRK